MLAGVAYLSVLVYRVELEKKIYKEDLVELSKVKYGIFSVDKWKEILESIITKKVREFDFDELPKDEIRVRVSDMLYKMSDNLESSFKEEKGFIPKAVAGITGIFDKIEDQVPEFTNIIMQFIEDPLNERSAREFALTKLDELTDSTFSQINYVDYDNVIEKYGCAEPEVLMASLESKIEELNDHYKPLKIILFSLAALAGLILLLTKDLTPNEFFILTLICLVFLATGLSLPMIEIDARISEMNFSLLGETIEFHNQILYYKNKSIIEVVEVMITQNKFDLIAVGSLVLLFSVIFPLSKLITSMFYVYFKKFRQSSLVKFIIFRTGKWSMADVMVLAIFMAFIGFSGILREQLQQIEVTSPTMDLLTTNESRLQVGFYAFLSFAILGLLISHRLQYSFIEEKEEELEKRARAIKERKNREQRSTSKAKG